MTLFKTKKQPAGTNGYQFEHVERILILNYDERLVYLANFILKNYYQKPTYLINDYVIECLQKERRQANKDREWNNPSGLPFGIEYADQADDIQVIINGHRYNLS